MQIEEGVISASLDKKLGDLPNSKCYSKAESNIFFNYYKYFSKNHNMLTPTDIKGF